MEGVCRFRVTEATRSVQALVRMSKRGWYIQDPGEEG